jgi:hypothetical protein
MQLITLQPNASSRRDSQGEMHILQLPSNSLTSF